MLARHLASEHKAYLCGENMRYQDIAYGYKPGIQHSNIIVFHYSRSMSGDFHYSALESFKDSCLMSSKYESCTKRFEKCHVVVFSNEAPSMDALTRDRYRFLDLDLLRQVSKKYFETGNLPEWGTVPLLSQLWTSEYGFGRAPTTSELQLMGI